jgi:NAD(P)-dependent dehydrogenase (short-subunit alcohol dehydrogenase family)
MQFLSPGVDYTTGSTEREEPEAKTLEVNLQGALWTTQLAIAYLTRRGLGKEGDRHILFVASVAGLFGAPMSPFYSVGEYTSGMTSIPFHPSRAWRCCTWLTDLASQLNTA